MSRGDDVLAAARKLIGTRFRWQGREATTGVDCVGLVAQALVGAGHRQALHAAVCDYRMRGGSIAGWEARLRAAGLERAGDVRAGDVVLVQAGTAQFHLMIATGEGHVHAHAGLRQVVDMPGVSPWPEVSRWRCPDHSTGCRD